MKVPAGTQSGRVFRLRGKGLPVFGGYGKGDQLVRVVVEVPEKVSNRQRELIAQLAEEMTADSHPQQKSFLDKLKSMID
jgi:molecular chaperone DnaJ